MTSFAALGSPLAGLLALTPQAETYGKSVSQVSYGVSLPSQVAYQVASLTMPISIALDIHCPGWHGGWAFHPAAFVPCHRSHLNDLLECISYLDLQHLGRLHDEILTIHPYLVSRFFAGFGATVPSALGPRILLDLFYIHERGRAFSVLLCPTS